MIATSRALSWRSMHPYGDDASSASSTNTTGQPDHNHKRAGHGQYGVLARHRTWNTIRTARSLISWLYLFAGTAPTFPRFGASKKPGAVQRRRTTSSAVAAASTTPPARPRRPVPDRGGRPDGVAPPPGGAAPVSPPRGPGPVARRGRTCRIRRTITYPKDTITTGSIPAPTGRGTHKTTPQTPQPS